MLQYKTIAPFVLRIFLGIVFLHAGLSKLLIRGTESFAASATFFPYPLIWAWFVITIEIIGGFFLIIGLFTKWSSIPLATIMTVAVTTLWLSKGFYATYAALLGATGCIVLFILGAGIYSLERAAFGKEW